MLREEGIKSIFAYYIRYNDETLLTSSLNYVNDDRNKYADIPSIPLNVLKHDNLGRLHFYTPYSGPSSVFLRSPKFNSTTKNLKEIIRQLRLMHYIYHRMQKQ